FTYDNVGNIATLVDERGNTTTFSYDELYRLTSRTDRLGQKSSYSYNATDDLTDYTDRLGHQTNITYDALDRPVRGTYADAVVQRTFDAAGRLVRLEDNQSGAISWNFDEADRLLSEIA